MDLAISSRLVIPSSQLIWRFSRSSGPGGQNVNKTDTRVELLFDINESSVISSFQKKILLSQLKSHISGQCVRVVVQEKRSQYQNRKLALSKLGDLIREALNEKQKIRLGTKPTNSSHKRRLDLKKQRGEIKKSRQKKDFSND